MAPFDFTQLSQIGDVKVISNPADLFDSLPTKSEGYGYLRAVQKTILDEWHRRRNQRDLVIKTNTGSGKTIIGLLILQSCINESFGPALYLAPDPHLADQVAEESRKLGIEIVRDPVSTKFTCGETICVTTMTKLINGRSRFGLAGASGRLPTDVRSIIVDDAHSALALAENQTLLSIPRIHPAYKQLIQLFEDELGQQSENGLLKIKETDPSAYPMRVPFWIWHDKRSDILKLLYSYREHESFEWSWPLISDILPWCNAIVGPHCIEITPLCPPIEKFPSFANAKRRIYLTATLADDSLLITNFGADAESTEQSIIPDNAGDLGDRLIIVPQILNQNITHDEVVSMAKSLSDECNVVVLVPSHQRATLWSDVAIQTASTSADITNIVNRLKADHVGLVVIVNRYDGIDLPDDACRVLIIDGLPQAYNLLERREASALRNSEAMFSRQLQRLEQGMGRGVRSRDDRCAVILLGESLAKLISSADANNRFSPATKAQLSLSQKMAHQLVGTNISEIEDIVKQVIKGDYGFRKASREALVGIKYDRTHSSPIASLLRKAYDAAVINQLHTASDHASRAVEAAVNTNEIELAGWLGETLATYLHPIDAVRAQNALITAIERNSAVLRPISGIGYTKVTSSISQARSSLSYLDTKYSNGQYFRLGIEAILENLTFNNENTENTEAALEDLANTIGLVGQRPEKQFGKGSDVLWGLGTNKYAVIETKTGATSSLISKRDINQLAGSLNWCKSQYGNSAKVIPVMVHPADTVERTGTPPSGTRIINKEKLDALKNSVRAFAIALADQEYFKNETKIHEQILSHSLAAGDIINRFSVIAKSQIT